MSEIEQRMIFEFLPNEILIECFKYLNAFNLFYSFDGLNSRWHNLIRNVRLYINFEDVNKTMFDKFCATMLIDSNIRNQIYSIEILNEDQCFQCNLFFRIFLPNKFPNLQRFTSVYPLLGDKKDSRAHRYNEYSNRYERDDDQHIHLKIKQSDLPLSQLRTLSILNLASLRSNIHKTSSIINLAISKFYFKDSQCLFNNLPMLKYLQIKSFDLSDEKNPNILSNYQYGCHLEQLIIGQFDEKFENFEMFVKQTPNLKSLTFISDHNQDLDMIDANRWEHLIVSSIPKLNTFNFKCSYYGYSQNYRLTHQTKINILKQFQSDFWKEQHHWYFEYIEEEDHSIFFYTIPDVCDTYRIKYNWTSSSNNLVNTFTNVKNLTLKYKELVENSKYYFPNVTSLTLTKDHSDKLPTTERSQYLKTMINLFKLKHLAISNDINASFLLEIFKQTPQLSSVSTDLDCLLQISNDKYMFDYLTKTNKNFNFIIYYNSESNSAFKMKDFYKMLPNIKHLRCKIGDIETLFVMIDNLPKLSTVKITGESGSNLDESGLCRDESAFGSKKNFLKFKNEASKRNIIYDMIVNRVGDDNRYGRYTPMSMIFTTLFIWIDNKHTFD